MSKENQKITKTFSGTVVSTKMDKSIVVRVDSLKWHSKYKKQYKSSKRYTVHDEKGQCQEGEQVTFVECRPLSKTKKWRVNY